ncbi:1-phosphofructokinase [Exiguobacterium indicum]|uniref:Tagatose-6-phosphate kinase n=1 Tax=Exiguobacterium indicum TaxID=296995 RepID=A0A0V8GGD8_9BACL|nr:1-phosphofructokinase [Exiguobacterium enclense]KSU49367.1 1-phosphofructokinase [Exiguobacterium enclense]SDC56020.1 fructose-1-phosphate kinase [Exiguobacterium enclense]
MIYTLTLNPSIDYYVTLPVFEAGQVNRVEQAEKVAGGKGINVSLVLKNYEVETQALGFLGGSTGQFIRTELEKRGVLTDFTPIQDETRINVKIRADQESELNAAGPKIQPEELEHLLSRFKTMEAGDIVVFAGSIPSSLPHDLYRHIATILNERNVRFAVDTTKEAMLEVLPLGPFLIKPNHHELGEIFDVEITSKEMAVPYAQQLVERGAENVVISFAGDGALLVNREGAYTANTPAGKLVNSVGAGDSLVAGFVASHALGKSPEEAFRYAVTTGSASAYSFGLCSKEDIDRLIKDVNVVELIQS